jgi:hypothetical protein
MDFKTGLGVVFTITMVFILSSFGWFIVGAYSGTKEAKNQTTIECIEKPELCKQRYEFIKLREKLGEN